MIALVLVAVFAMVAVTATVLTVRTDCSGKPPASRLVDPDFLPPAARLDASDTGGSP